MSLAFRAVDPVIDTLIGDKIVAHRPQFARAFGGATVGLLLSQFWFYSMMDTAKAREGWFYAPQEQIEEDTGLTRTEQETARRKLREAGILAEDKAGIPAKLWYQINKERAIEQLRLFLIAEAKQKEGRERKKEQAKEERAQARPISPGKDAENPQTRTQKTLAQGRPIPADKQAQKAHAITKTPLRLPKKSSETAAPPGVSLALFQELGFQEPEAARTWVHLTEAEQQPYRVQAEQELVAMVGLGEWPKLRASGRDRQVRTRAETLYKAMQKGAEEALC